jgi:hypothetical protein
LISLGGIFYAAYKNPKARPIMILGLGWFLAALLPVLNIAPLINEYSFILTSEHFLYLPIVGILILVVTAIHNVIPAKGPHAGHSQLLAGIQRFLLGFVVSICLLLTWHQNTFWQSETALFERMLRFEPNFARGHLLLAKAYYFNGRPQEADGHFQRAYMIMSGYAKKAANSTAKNFYLGYMNQILWNWAQNNTLYKR